MSDIKLWLLGCTAVSTTPEVSLYLYYPIACSSIEDAIVYNTKTIPLRPEENANLVSDTFGCTSDISKPWTRKAIRTGKNF